MESYRGGYIANRITDIPGSSEIIKFSAIIYLNEYKIKMGVNKSIIDKYTVYSKETAASMSKNISDFTNSNYGIGITGKLCSSDPNNSTKENDLVYISIYDKDIFYEYNIKVKNQNREKNKQLISEFLIEKLNEII